MAKAKASKGPAAKRSKDANRVIIARPGTRKQAEKTFGVSAKRSKQIDRLVEEAVG